MPLIWPIQSRSARPPAPKAQSAKARASSPPCAIQRLPRSILAPIPPKTGRKPRAYPASFVLKYTPNMQVRGIYA